ncbi:MAG TPA: WXG100 family type VII secretion target [Micromonosporaceae bacterium]|jgi:WXG100 family type VII secretion target
MGDVMYINFPALQKASADIQAALNTMESQLGELERDAAPLVATWDGDAKAAYEQRQARWRSAAADLSAMLRDIKVAVDDSAADYLQTEKKNTQLFE